jgi:hypothetical protein
MHAAGGSNSIYALLLLLAAERAVVEVPLVFSFDIVVLEAVLEAVAASSGPDDDADNVASLTMTSSKEDDNGSMVRCVCLSCK